MKGAKGESTTAWDDYRWLTGPAARAGLQAASAELRASVQLVRRLRADYGPQRAALLIEQAELRRRAAVKFPRAAEMFFTRTRLEQATDQRLADYKAERFPAGDVADLCCGIGGDLLALAQHRQVIGIDRDPIAACLCAANAASLEVDSRAEVRVGEAGELDLARLAVWHCDPDRRASGGRTVRAETFQPPAAAIAGWLDVNPHASIKLAPASPLPAEWPDDCQREWLGARRQALQQVAWFGDLRQHSGRQVTLLDVSAEPWILRGEPDVRPAVADRRRHFLAEPHAAIFAARLVGALAEQQALPAYSDDGGWLTADERPDCAGLAAFRAVDAGPLDRKRWRREIRRRGIGRLEIKVRGANIDPERLRKELQPRGPEQATLIVLRRRAAVEAVLAERMPADDREPNRPHGR